MRENYRGKGTNPLNLLFEWKARKWIFFLMLSAGIFASAGFCAVDANAGAVWDGTADTAYLDAAGVGDSAENPYIIDTAEQLAGLAVYVNEGNNLSGKYVKLAADIDLGGNPNQWIPIGTSSRRFEGTFDGGNKKITRLYINRTASANGLFGYIADATIKNLGIEDVDITSAGSINGSLIGRAGYPTVVENCYASGSITGSNYVGGLIGVTDNATITKCYAAVNVTASNSTSGVAGGLVGYAPVVTGQAASAKTTIEQSYATGNVTGNGYVGGLVGQGVRLDVNNCFASGSVTAANSSAYAGGLIGYYSDSTNKVKNSYAYGEVTAANIQYAGQLIGCGAGASYKNVEDSFARDAGKGLPVATNLDISELSPLLSGNEFSNRTIFTDAGWEIPGVWRYVADPSGRPFLSAFVDADDEYVLGNAWPEPRDPVPGQTVNVGGTVTFTADTIATDDDEDDDLTITEIVGTVSPDTAIASAALEDGVVTLTGAGPGDTNVVVIVSDGKAATRIEAPIHVTAPATPTYTASVTPDDHTFESAAEGYTPTAQQFIITNTGNETLTNLHASLAGNDFEISAVLNTETIAPGNTATVSVQPKANLSVGLHTDTLTITGANGLSAAAALSFTVEAANAGKPWDGSTRDTAYLDAAGVGDSAENPYIIDTAEQLAGLAERVNAGNNLSGKFVKLAANIDLGGNPNQWTPIGTTGVRFAGTFDGGNKKITRLFIKGGESYAGLFGATAGATIKNLGVEDVDITTTTFGGGALIAYAYYPTIVENCYASGSIANDGTAGGLIGQATCATITKCYAAVNVTASNGVAGGLVGNAALGTGQAASAKTTIEQSYATGNVATEVSSNVGGLVGQGARLEVNNCFASGNVKGANGVGGLIGTYSDNTNKVKNSYAYGEVTTTNTTQSAGQLIGRGAGASYKNVENSFARDTGNGLPVATALDTSELSPLLSVNEFSNRAIFKNAGWEIPGVWRYVADPSGRPFLSAFVDDDEYVIGNAWPEPRDPMPAQTINGNGATVTFTADTIATDDDADDELTITEIVGTVSPDAAIASAAWEDGVVTLTGAGPGDTSVVVSVSDGKATTRIEVPIRVTASATPTYTASVTPDDHTFESAAEGYTPTAQQFIITNTGNETLTNLQASLAGNDFEISAVLNTETIAPGNTATVSVQPKANLSVGPHTGTLTITGDNGLSATAALSFTVTITPHRASVTPPNHTFAAAVPGYTPTAREFTVTNTGGETLTNLQASLAGEDFEISAALSTATIAPGNTATVSVQPKANLPAGNHTGALRITGDNGLSAAAALSFVVTADDAGKPWDGSAADTAYLDVEGVGGSAENPYIIDTAAKLAGLAERVNAGNALSGKYVKLAADIDLGGIPNTWTPIGTASYKFGGTFDGDNKKITRLYINTSALNSGLFGATYGATIKNLGIEGVDITSTGNCAGALIGNAAMTNVITSRTFVENCYAIGGNIRGASITGGLIGQASGAAITRCYAEVNVTGSGTYTGGFVGYVPAVMPATLPSTTIEQSYATGDVTGTTHVGGLVGFSARLIVNDCFASGNVTATGGYAGGLIGYHQGGNRDDTVKNSYAYGVVATASTSNVGQLAGRFETATIENCFARDAGNGRGLGTYVDAAKNHLLSWNEFSNRTIFKDAGWEIPDVWRYVADPPGRPFLSAFVDDDEYVIGNAWPEPRDPVPAQTVNVGGTVTFTADTIATDDDEDDELTIIEIVATYPVSPDTMIASAALNDGLVTLTGAGPGDTSVVVSVYDGKAATHIEVPIRVTAAPTTISIAPPSHTFAAATAGYTPSAREFIVTNTGNETLTNLQASVTGNDFEISADLSPATIAPGSAATVSVRPKANLSVGPHTGTLTITGANGLSAAAALSFTVTAGGNAVSLPGAPTGVSATASVENGVARAVVTFTPPTEDENTGNVLTYVVRCYKVPLSPANLQKTVNGNSSPVTISMAGLNVNDYYVFTAAAVNSVGEGPASEPSNFVSPANSTPDYAASIAPLVNNFGTTDYGYAAITPVVFTVTNAGLNTLSGMTATITGEDGDAFEITSPAGGVIGAIAPGSPFNLSVGPKSGLSADIYSGTLTITDAGNHDLNLSADLSFTVRKANQPQPLSPSVSVTTDNMIEVYIPDGDNGRYVPYKPNAVFRIKTGDSNDWSSWQPSGVFAGLAPETEYSFQAWFEGTANYNESSLSEPSPKYRTKPNRGSFGNGSTIYDGASGDGWTFGNGTLYLDPDYAGGPVSFVGDVIVELTGAIEIANTTDGPAINSKGGVTIVGDGSLTLTSAGSAALAADGKLTVSGGTLNVTATGAGSAIKADEAEISGGVVNATATGEGSVGLLSSGDVTISGEASVTASGAASGIESTTGDVSITEKAIVTANGTGENGIGIDAAFGEITVDLEPGGELTATGNGEGFALLAEEIHFDGVPEDSVILANLDAEDASEVISGTVDGVGKDAVTYVFENSFVAVEDIEDGPSGATVGTDLALTGTVKPDNATNKTITWTVKSADTTGATITGSKLSTTAAGTVTVTAAIASAKSDGSAFTKDFTITVTDPSVFVPVTDITGVPTTATVGTDLALTGTVKPDNATNKTITWTVKNADTTGATITGSKLSTTAAGTVTVTAAIASAKSDGSAFTKDFKITVKAATPSYTATISPTSKDFPAARVGYSSPAAQEFTITNTGVGTLKNVTASLVGSFEISKALSSKTISADKTATLSVRPKRGLSAGEYTGQLVISGDEDLHLSANLSFTVSGDASAPSGDPSGDSSDDGYYLSEIVTPIAKVPDAITAKVQEEFDAAASAFAAKGFTLIDPDDVKTLITLSGGVIPSAVKELGENVENFVEVKNGLLTAKDAVIKQEISKVPSLKNAIDTSKPIVTHEPVVLSAPRSGATVIVPIPVEFSALSSAGATTFGDIVLMKLKEDGLLAAPARKQQLADIAREGDYIIKDATGETVSDSTSLNGGRTYYVYIAITDDGAYDWDKLTPGNIFDPLCSGIRSTGGGSGDGDGDDDGNSIGDSGSGSGGCDAGMAGAAGMLAVVLLASARRRRFR